ncbi:phosphoribosylformylglycinamidine synthase subunit PurQ [Roseicyclus sp. F158]|uniref:Phosphoribosylformylglycinamidine synthase subunit PurQ n=1 Tax=Tropicimonas omnivorans TaxID=3075590 RepID=A0ABU3DIA7_9RHOB|nr:phosphoribosylformylglycinamidine synthase subunit PurQ [Roseicyclus sp. F158]MDT0683465.1 phosphoribosylformylglycinamidine synthase subunit PurQ [Roseicyclus sp. F158]
MRAAVVTFPGSNCDRDLALALDRSGFEVVRVWHKDTALPAGIDLVGLPGGFSFGDYLRCGAIAANSPICREVVRFAEGGGHVLGICNGFQILLETGLLPGALMRNSNLKFICKTVTLRVETALSPFTTLLGEGATLDIPVAHHDGNYQASPELIRDLDSEARVAFRYGDPLNGSAGDIAGILSQNRRVLGMMPHPERASEAATGSSAGAAIFDGIASAFASA